MNLLRGFQSPSIYRGGFVSIGNFDGVHLGHQHIAGRLAEQARRERAPAVVLTFDPHPLRLLRPEHAPPSLTTLEQKAELLEQAGVACVIVYPTDAALLNLTPEQFFDAIVVAELQAKGIVEGPNFCFGKNRKGDVGTLRDLCESRGIALEIVEPIGGCERIVSSSEIRSLLVAGELAEANKLLGHPYRIRGKVVLGAQRGRMIGFPTANLAEIETLLPRDGVYAGLTHIDGQRFAAAVNVGPNPTFNEETPKVEAHVIGFSGELYGRSLAVDLVGRIRGTQRFDGPDALRRQLAVDVEAARASAAAASRP